MNRQLLLGLAWLFAGSGWAAGQAGGTVAPFPYQSAAPSEVISGDGDKAFVTPPPLTAAIGISSPNLPNVAPFWLSADYLAWWLKPVCLKAPIMTIGSTSDAVPGAAGQPNSRTVVGPGKFEFGFASGVRPTIGAWLTPDHFLSWEASGFLLEQVANSESFHTVNGGPAAFLPYQSPSGNQALPFSVPGVVNAGSVAVGRTHLWGVETNLAAHFSEARGSWLISGAGLLGFRYLDLSDSVTVVDRQSLVSDPSVAATGADRFSTHNQFYGGQLGSQLAVLHDRWSLELTTKVALGWTHEVSVLNGAPLTAGSPVAPGLLPGPFLVMPSNFGRQASDVLTLVPEIGVKTRYNLTDSVSLSLGYSCLYWNRVLCPGDQMDPRLNVTQVPGHGPVVGPALPAPVFQHTDAFAQGFNAGVEFRY